MASAAPMAPPVTALPSGGNREVLKKKYYHLIILVKNQMGLKNLYKIVSEAHVNYFFKKPRVPRSLLNKYRDGLLLTSACEAGQVLAYLGCWVWLTLAIRN